MFLIKALVFNRNIFYIKGLQALKFREIHIIILHIKKLYKR